MSRIRRRRTRRATRGWGRPVSVLPAPELADVNGPDGTVGRALLRKTFGRFPTGVTAVCAVADGRPAGFAASSFNTVSANPPLVSLCVQSESTTWPRVRAAERIGVSVLSVRQSLLGRQLAMKAGDRFAGVSWIEGEGHSLLLAGSAAWFECSIEFAQPVGDHEVTILRVLRLGADPEQQPLVFGDSVFQQMKPLAAAPKPGTDPARETLLSLALGWW